MNKKKAVQQGPHNYSGIRRNKSASRRDRLRIGAKLKRYTRAQLGRILNHLNPTPIDRSVPKRKMLEAVAQMTGARLSKCPTRS